MSGVSLTVHRSTNHIGGNCIEIVSASGARLILDVGRPLDAPSDAVDLLPATLDLKTSADVLISHSHQDHWGLLNEVPKNWTIHCGVATSKLIAITAEVSQRPIDNSFVPWKGGVPFTVGPFLVTPHLTDHSAFDAYMLMVEVDGRKLLYSGDFRRHGRKGVLVDRLMESPPVGVDVLLMEGTNLGSDKSTIAASPLTQGFFARPSPSSGSLIRVRRSIAVAIMLFSTASTAFRPRSILPCGSVRMDSAISLPMTVFSVRRF